MWTNSNVFSFSKNQFSIPHDSIKSFQATALCEYISKICSIWFWETLIANCTVMLFLKQLEPSKRLSAKEAMSHRYFNDLSPKIMELSDGMKKYFVYYSVHTYVAIIYIIVALNTRCFSAAPAFVWLVFLEVNYVKCQHSLSTVTVWNLKLENILLGNILAWMKIKS